MNTEYIDKANNILHSAYGENANFRYNQLEAILAVLDRKKTLLVQRTGWGKSIVYFIATRILREEGAGPTIIVSPLLALMKNQVDSAEKIGIQAVTINSDNRDDHVDIYANFNFYDAIIISPERLSDAEFMEHLADIRNIQLFVVDEAHSISDWGHDFRPDYQRIVKLLHNLPSDIAILGTTATANERVIKDIKNQLGEDLNIVKGDLIRDNLAIQINPCQSREERLAWILQYLTIDNRLKYEQGIIYCLTQRDCGIVADFLKQYDLSAESYHSGLDKEIAQERIENFSNGNLRILVATIKLGMGYDKSNIRFVFHYQLPQNLISYYQQIGRAGRDNKLAYAILLHGEEDEDIVDHFIKTAQVEPDLLNDILELTRESVSLRGILSELNISVNKATEALKFLQIHDYIYKDRNKYNRNITKLFDRNQEYDKQKLLNRIRKNEFLSLNTFVESKSCYMKLVANELDAPDQALRCGICSNCRNQYLIPIEIDMDNLKKANMYLKNRHGKILPRKKWSDNKIIIDNLRFKEGWTLSDDYYSQLGQQIKEQKYDVEQFSLELVCKSIEFLENKVKQNNVDLVLAVPSKRRPHLVPDFAKQLADGLGIQFENIVTKLYNDSQQKTLQNSAKQQANIEKSIEIAGYDHTKIIEKTILLVDDMVDSRWTFTVIAAKLLKVGAKAVYPFALVKTGGGN